MWMNDVKFLGSQLLYRGAHLICIFSYLIVAVEAHGNSSNDERFFESKVRPLLVEHCHECHSSEISEAGLRLDSHQFVLRGSDAGVVIQPGNIQKSKLITVIKASDDTSMPPDGKLSAEEIATLEEWVLRGVPWSGVGSNESPLSDDSESMSERIASTKESHWSFQPRTKNHEQSGEPVPRNLLPDNEIFQ